MGPIPARLTHAILAVVSLLGGTGFVSVRPATAEKNPAKAASHVAQDSVGASEVRVVRAGVELTLVAEHPSIVTPTGIDVDRQGRVWVISSHTHFRPDNYTGPEHDEVVVLSGSQFDERRVFYAQTDATMDLELGEEGWVYLAERDRVLRVRDSNGDGVGDVTEQVAVLETTADYPHNGLSGLAWHPSGDLMFSLGENHWESWTLRGSSGDTVRGSGEGGIFRCRPDGSSLRRIAKGFWNPFGLCVREDGTIFAAENDPGARPPCRLLHIVEGGDYGYQRLYGNAPTHPFVCWNGELRGTLPMLHALGEAPCGIVPLGSGVLVPSWTDHRIDFYPLTPDGASYSTERIVLATGGRNFRPTCIAAASPNEFYLTDWVEGSYQLHGKGRVWRLRITPQSADWIGPASISPPTAEQALAADLRTDHGEADQNSLFRLARSEDPFIARAALDALARRVSEFEPEMVFRMPVVDRVSFLLAAKANGKALDQWAEAFLQDDAEEVRFETLRWLADSRHDKYLPAVEQILQDPECDYRVFEAAWATWNTLSGQPRKGIIDDKMLTERVSDMASPPQTRAFALRLIDPQRSGWKKPWMDQLQASRHPSLIREWTRTLASRGTGDAQKRLRQIASDSDVSLLTRADAIAGIRASSADSITWLLSFAASETKALREESLRSLRFAQLSAPQQETLQGIATAHPDSADLVAAAIDPTSVTESRPPAEATSAWALRLSEIDLPTDLDAGRRLFHHPSVGLCANCHRHDGRGRVVGPDLSAVSNDGDANHLLRALLEPSRDVDPQYYPWSLLLDGGRTFTGILLRDGGGGTEFFRNSQGREQKILTEQVVERKALTTSMMPRGLVDLMTDREVRDLLAFLDGGQLSVTRAGKDANRRE